MAWVLDPLFFTEFAADTLVNVQVKDLTGYLCVLNDHATLLANSLPTEHPAQGRLTANKGKPWHADIFQRINSLYQQKLVSRKHLAALKGEGILQPSRIRKKSKRSEATSIAAPVKTLNDLLVSSEGLKTKLKELYETAPMAGTVKGYMYKGVNRKRGTAIIPFWDPTRGHAVTGSPVDG